jgi:hypothetical protein
LAVSTSGCVSRGRGVGTNATDRPQVRGRSRKMTIGSYLAIGLKVARDMASIIAAQAAQGRDPAFENQADKRPGHGFVETVAEDFVKRHVRVNRCSGWAAEVERVLRNEILPAFRRRGLSELRRPDMNNLLNRIVDRGSPIRANRVLAVFKRLVQLGGRARRDRSLAGRQHQGATRTGARSASVRQPVVPMPREKHTRQSAIRDRYPPKG